MTVSGLHYYVNIMLVIVMTVDCPLSCALYVADQLYANRLKMSKIANNNNVKNTERTLAFKQLT